MAVPPRCPRSSRVSSVCVTPGTVAVVPVPPCSSRGPGACVFPVPTWLWWPCHHGTCMLPCCPGHAHVTLVRGLGAHINACATLVPVWSWCLCHLAALTAPALAPPWRRALVPTSPWYVAPATHWALRAPATPVPLVPARW